VDGYEINRQQRQYFFTSHYFLREAVYQAYLNIGADTQIFASNIFDTPALGGTEILIRDQNVNKPKNPTQLVKSPLIKFVCASSEKRRSRL
jgi:hypothetical protein